MGVRITREKVEIDGKSVSYYPYYFDQWWNEEAEDRLVVLKKVVAQWADELDKAEGGRTLYLPYSLDDEGVGCFQAEVRGEEVVFRCVEVKCNGYAIDLDGLGGFIAYPHELWGEKPETFGTYNKQALVSGLRSAEVSDA